MLFAFIDESGKPNIKENTPFVLAAVLVDEQDVSSIEKSVYEAAKTSIPALQEPFEIHSNEIIHRIGVFENHTETNRIRLYENVCNEIAKSNLTLLSSIVTKTPSKSASPVSPKQAMEQIEEIAFEHLLERILLEASNKTKADKILAVIDQSGFSHDHKLQERIRILLRNGEYLKKFSSKITLFGPDFRDSKEHVMLQISDVVSYTLFQCEQKKKIRDFDFDKYFNIIKPRFSNKLGIINGYGIKIWDYNSYNNL